MSDKSYYWLTAVVWCSVVAFFIGASTCAHAEIFAMNCYPDSAPVYLVTFNTETRVGVITGSRSGHHTKYTAHDVKDVPERHMLYVAMTTAGQTRTVYLAFDYSGSRDISQLKTKDNGHEAIDKCQFMSLPVPGGRAAAQPHPAPPSPPPPDIPQVPAASDHIFVVPCVADGNLQDCAIVGVDGMITPGDRDEFVSKTKGLAKATVFLAGDGGDLRAGINIGEIIHARGWGTFVPNNFRCRSSCANIWAAGAPHTMGIGSELVWHSPFVTDDPGHANGNGAGLLGSYLRGLGYSYNQLDNMIGNDPNDMYFMRRDAAGNTAQFACRWNGSQCITKEGVVK